MESGSTKISRTFQGCSVMHVGSEGALTVWIILDFQLPRNFNVTLLATKIAPKHQWKSFKTHFSEVNTQWNPFSIFQWMRMIAKMVEHGTWNINFLYLGSNNLMYDCCKNLWRIFFSDLLFLKKVVYKSEFPDFAFLSISKTYAMENWMFTYLLITCFTIQCYWLTLTSYIVLSGKCTIQALCKW